MAKVLILGGTSEGRKLAEYCGDHGIPAVVSVATEYGAGMVKEYPHVKTVVHRLDPEQMEQWLKEEAPEAVIDATHPYARLVSQYGKECCSHLQIPYIRVLREKNSETWEKEQLITVSSMEEAAAYLSTVSGNVLITTGSKELEAFTKVPDYEKRLYVRVLPSVESLKKCEQLGFPKAHVIAMQGPFSVELNGALLKQTEAGFLVTKDSGTAGGVSEKLEAAELCKVQAIVIGRPEEAEGISLEEAISYVGKWREGSDPLFKVKVSLVGIGMGRLDQMTMEAARAVKQAEIIFGAPRMLEAAGHGSQKKMPFYRSEDIMRELEQGCYRQAAVLYSGDTGYYSGAAGMAEFLKKGKWKHTYQAEIIPGTSSLSYFCGKLQRPWQELISVSMHGRKGELLEALGLQRPVFVLTGGEYTVSCICGKLVRSGYGDCIVFVGENLSYETERITRGTAEELQNKVFDALSVMLIEHQEKKFEEMVNI